MPLSVYVAHLEREDSRVTATVVIQPSDLAAFRIETVFVDQGSQEKNLHHVQGVLQRFSADLDLAAALKRPLRIAPKPAAKE